MPIAVPEDFLTFDPNEWHVLGEGTYHNVYKSNKPMQLDPDSTYNGYWVLKFPKYGSILLDNFSDYDLEELVNLLKKVGRDGYASDEEKELCKDILGLNSETLSSKLFFYDECKILKKLLQRYQKQSLVNLLSESPVFDEFNGPFRAQRITEELYQHHDRMPNHFVLKAPSANRYMKSSYAWVMPYLDGRQASDDEMCEALIDIYKRTRRIVVDAPAKKNFLTVKDSRGKEKTICIDVDWALRRTNSKESLNATDDIYKTYDAFFKAYISKYPKTISLIKNLLYLEERLDPPHTLDIYITPKVIESLTLFRNQKYPLSCSLLKNLNLLCQKSQALDDFWLSVLGMYTNSNLAFDDEFYGYIDRVNVALAQGSQERGLLDTCIKAFWTTGNTLSRRDWRAMVRAVNNQLPSFAYELYGLCEAYDVDKPKCLDIALDKEVSTHTVKGCTENLSEAKLPKTETNIDGMAYGPLAAVMGFFSGWFAGDDTKSSEQAVHSSTLSS